MTTMNISLPDSMRAFIEQKVVEGGYSTASEYIRQLVRDDQKHAAQQRLEQLLLEGLDSGPPIEISDEYWAAKKADLLKRVGEQRLKRPYILRPAADRDVDEHFLYLAKQSRNVAIRFLHAADATFEQLATMPELGQRQEFGGERLAGLRAWQVRGFENYLIFYRPIERGIEVLRVLHAARDTAAILEDQA